MRLNRAFTLIELLVVIAIISVLVGLLVPMIDRSLSRNRLANDVEVLRSKLEEVRLLAGSTRAIDEPISNATPDEDKVGYYGLYLPSIHQQTLPNSNLVRPFFAIVRISDPFEVEQGKAGVCHLNLPNSGSNVIWDASNRNSAPETSRPCLVEKIYLTRGVSWTANDETNFHERIIAFRVPSQQAVEFRYDNRQSPPSPRFKIIDPPKFDWGSQGGLIMRYRDKQAKINFEKFTAKLKESYENVP